MKNLETVILRRCSTASHPSPLPWRIGLPLIKALQTLFFGIKKGLEEGLRVALDGGYAGGMCGSC